MIRKLQKQGYIDALRGYAILGVLLVHSAQQVPPASHVLKLLRNFGIYGVQLFYVVSALALFMSWHFRNDHELSPVRNFFIRRLFRIAPMFWVVTVAFLALYGTAPGYWAPNGIHGWQIVGTLLFVNGFHPEAINAVVPGGWSVAVEMCFYLILPLLFCSIKNMRTALGFLAISLGIYIVSPTLVDSLFAGTFPSRQQYLLESFKYQNLMGQLPVFAMGVVTYFMVRDFSHSRVAAKTALGVAGVMLVLVAVFPKSPLIHHHLTMGVLLASLTFTLACYQAKRVANLLIVFIGKISYSMYLTQFFVIFTLRDLRVLQYFSRTDWGWLAYFLIATILIIMVSTLTHRYIEQPGIRLGQKLIAHLELTDEKRATEAPA
ncbi:uncharacterized protein NMK_2338 [Novimethylophilus kurashikiensis]|uniref:Acyltransferase 3 domain-containing protein n=1 Tax=Novimethylophilus kurashikiensis TaxID=1825523 RepID=A0A2R5F964_9PROT|nr:acyltransferase [Novimethylophilus kurashikiensis]GBG14737.1 uncharacterized protein NMK_2338 [Novimethylophilus kurashikiensis]